MASDRDWILVEFKGTYKVPHKEGFRGQSMLKPFHVQVEMERSFLLNLKPYQSLRGTLATYYMNILKQSYPDMIELHRFDMVEATEVDGDKIHDPRAMRHADLIDYIQKNKLPINISLYNDQDLRHEVALYEQDKKGQQHIQGWREKVQGGMLEVSKRISERGVKIHVLDPSDEHHEKTEDNNHHREAKLTAKPVKEVKAAATAKKVEPAPSKDPFDVTELDSLTQV